MGSDQRRQRRSVQSGPKAEASDPLRSCRLREFEGLLPSVSFIERARGRRASERFVAERWADRKTVCVGSPTRRYLARKRLVPSAIIEAASAAGVLRESPAGSAWFSHLKDASSVAHVDIRGPTHKGSLTRGVKPLFRIPLSARSLPRIVLAEAAIDARSIAAIENVRADTLYVASGWGMGPGTIAALEALLTTMAMLPGAVFCSAADANGAGDRFAECHQSLAKKFSVPFERLRPPIEEGDWNDVLRAHSQQQGSTS